MWNRTRGGSGLMLAAVLLVLGGCTDEPWNNPYPASQSGENILYTAFSERPRTLDPAKSYSSNEVEFTAQIYEPPLQYHYLKRPYELEPLTAVRMPQPSYLAADGSLLPADAPPEAVAESVYEIEIRPGIFYQPHPAFARDDTGELAYHALGPEQLAGIRTLDDFPLRGTRELVAADYVNQIKRLADPRLQSPILGLMSDYIVGLREYAATLQEAYAGQGDAPLDRARYDLEGAQVVDRYTYRIRVRGKYPQLKYWLAMPFFAAVPPEVERFYAQPGMNERNLNMDWYPVGTGPYMLTENNPNRRMVLERNPNYRADPYPSEGEPEDEARGLLRDAGRNMPFVDRVVFSLEKESIPAWSKFLQGYYDTSGIASDSFDQAVQFGSGGEAELTPAMRERGIELLTETQATTFYMGFNMLDPLVGGYGDRARKLRQAISIAIDYEDYISIFLNGRGTAAQGPLPPGIGPETPEREGINPYVYRWEDGQAVRRPIEDAKRLLAEAGYPNGRDVRTGEPLLIHLDVTGGGPEDKAYFDWLRKQFRSIDLELVIRNTDYNRFQEKMRKGNAQLFTWGWNADYPDAENFMFLLYGPNGKAEFGGENAANYNSAEFNRLFERMANMEDSPERAAIIAQMLDVARRDSPWIWGFHPKRFVLLHTWYHNAKLHLMANNTLKYRRIDPDLRAELRSEWNRPVVGPLALGGVLLLLALVPALHMYRRKERQPAIRETATDPSEVRASEEDRALDARQRRQQY